MSSTDERGLVQQAGQGDRDAFGEIVRRHQQAVFNVAYRILGNALDAADAAQATFIQTIESPEMNHLHETQLNEYLDNDLQPAARRAVDVHLQGCDECRANLNQLERLFLTLKNLPEIKLRHDLSDNILSKFSKRPAPLPTQTLAVQLGAVLGALVWLSMQLTRIPVHLISNFRFDRLIPPYTAGFPDFRTLILHPPFTIANLQARVSDSAASKIKIPALRFPAIDFQLLLHHLNLSAFNIAFIAISALMLWVFGNAFFLRDRSGFQE